jgi:hypothetical protein
MPYDFDLDDYVKLQSHKEHDYNVDITGWKETWLSPAFSISLKVDNESLSPAIFFSFKSTSEE